MADDIANNYAAQIAEMRQHRNATEQRERLSVLQDNYKVATEMRDEAAEEGNTEEWNNADKWCEELEVEYGKLAPQPQPDHEPKYRWLARRWDLPMTEEHRKLAKAAHDYHTGDRDIYGRPKAPIAENSQAYFDVMSAHLEPPGYEPPATPDDVAKACGLKPEEYNRQVEKLWEEKKKGNYND